MAKGKRISEISKDLGISSKDIITKCLAEGVPSDIVKGHMSVVSAGLEASIREWFSGGAVATAVETTEHVDVDRVKAKPAPRARKAKGDAEPPPADGTVAVAAPPAEPAAPRTPAAKPATSAPPATPSAPAAAAPASPAATPVRPSVSRATAPSAPTAPTPTASPAGPGAPPAHPTLARPTPTKAEPTHATPIRPAAAPEPAPVASAPAAASPPAPPAGPGAPAQSAPPTGGSATTPPPARPHLPRVGVKPAPMNVPTRPQVIAPAGPRLEVKQQVKLAGPKVVRIEAPEQVDVPGARRAGPGGPPRGGRGVVPGSAGDDDTSRSPRRNKRRGPGDAPAAVPARRRATSSPSEDIQVGTGFSEADLAEREARLARAGGYLRQRRRELKAREHAAGERAQTAAQTGGKVIITAPFTIKDLAAATGVKSADILKKLIMQGVMATVNSGIDAERAQEIMIEFDIELDIKTAQTAEQVVSSVFEKREMKDGRPRAPVVTIMGHVDHGKTSLLDAIRKTNVAAGEAGGITQKTSAFRVPVEIGGETKHIVFLDTPGHQAFTEMRSRGANMTDVVVLVVGAPEGVMPQTIESINHAKAAKVPIVVALNKIDSPQATDAQIQRVMGQLAEQGLNPVAWGGQTEVVKTSAVKGIGIVELLEVLDLQAQVLELKADFAGAARGRVIEATLAEGRGPIATVLVQDGELKVGDCIVVGRAFGRVRDITDDKGQRLKSAGPSMPIQISGFDEVPDAGDPFFITDSLKKAQEAAEQRRDRDRLESLHQPKVTLDSLLGQMKDAAVKEILIVLKADVQGSVDVIKHEVERLSTDEVKVRVLHAAVGGIQESDVVLAEASKAVIVGFNVIPNAKARALSEQKGVEYRTYQVIYDITEDVKKAASGMLAPEIRQEVLGHAEVRKVFKVSKVGTIAGCYVTDGLVQRDALIRVTRNGIVVENDRVLEQLKRFKDDAKDVRMGMECGMKIVGYDDIKEGDVLECYKKVEIKRTL
ncbi:MAG: translation initiation factor IF-2 [Phycisphaerae bacterium]|nr:translation initiation factor IF-2 [Phycisphaerae bacterium]